MNRPSMKDKKERGWKKSVLRDKTKKKDKGRRSNRD